MLLGIYPDPELVDQRLELLPGDALVLFTDGLAERRDPDDDPPGRIRELLRSSAGASASETAARLGQLALSDNGKPDDDVAVVVLRRVGSREHTAQRLRAPGESIAVELEPGPGVPPQRGQRSRRWPTRSRPGLPGPSPAGQRARHEQRPSRPASAADLIRLQVRISDRLIRVEVSDPGEGFGANVPEPVAARGPGGWGLFLTERLADRWGVDRESRLDHGLAGGGPPPPGPAPWLKAV